MEEGWISVAAMMVESSLRGLSGRQIKRPEIDRILNTLRVIRWNENIPKAIGNDQISELLRKLRASGLPRAEYEDIRAVPTQHWEEAPLVAPNWPIWTQMIRKYRLTQAVDIMDLQKTAIALDKGGILGPVQLADPAKRQALALEHTRNENGRIMLLWQTVKCQFETPSNLTASRFHANPRALPALLGRIKGKTVRDTEIHRDFTQISAKLGLPPTYDDMTPGNKIKTLESLRADPAAILELLARGG